MPDSVSLPGADRRVAIDPRDGRAYKKLVVESVRGRVSTPMMFWRDHVARHKGGLYLDIGANYGECLAYGDYPDGMCVGVEANTLLVPYLEETRRLHPDSERIRIVSALVSDRPYETARLFFDPAWTGEGSACEHRPGLKALEVSTDTLENIIGASGASPAKPLVMKMDVEGHEGRVIEGFPSLFLMPDAIGIMEFDTRMLHRAGTEPKTLFERLTSRFQVYLTFNRERRLLPLDSWESLARFGREGKLHRDLVFATSTEMVCPEWLN